MSRAFALLFGLLVALPTLGVGEQVERATLAAGSYAVHYNALTTDGLPPAVARAYGFRRSSATVLINIAVVREQAGTTGESVRAAVTLTVTNLVGQPKQLSEVREVIEGDAIYYLATTTVAPHETLDMRVQVVPEGEVRPIAFRYTQSFD